MDAILAANWNGVVAPDDVIWHLGDFAFRCEPERVTRIFERLNGRKHLIIGNHDNQHTLSLPWSAPPQMLVEIKVDDIRIALCHYGMRVWPGQRKGGVHLYGHSHGSLPGTSTSLDVGVDSWDYRPIGLPEILRRMATLPVVDPENHRMRRSAP